MLIGLQNNPVLIATDPATDDSYGYCVSLAKNSTMLVVGSEAWEGGTNDQGAVYTYDWTGSLWKQRGAVLLAPDAASGDFFGRAVSLTEDGLTLVVGAYQWEGSYTDQGGVYVFDWNGSAWIQRGSVLTAPDASSGDLFGQSAAISSDGNVLAVGAIAWEGSYTDQGAVYIFDKNGTGWTHRTTITAADATANFFFGRDVELNADGTVLVIGSDGWSGNYTSQGAVYTYDWNGSTWNQRGAVLTAFNAVTDDRFGNSVALSQDGLVLLVGAEKRTEDFTNQGRVYFYDWNGSSWVPREILLIAPDASAGDRFGKSITIGKNKDCILIGAHQWEGSYTNQGAVYMYTL